MCPKGEISLEICVLKGAEYLFFRKLKTEFKIKQSMCIFVQPILLLAHSSLYLILFKWKVNAGKY